MYRLLLFFQIQRFIHCVSMILWFRNVLCGMVWLTVVLCTFLPSVLTASFTLYEEWDSPEMTYCSYYTRIKLQELTTLSDTTDLTDESWILQGDAIVLIEQLLDNNLLLSVPTIENLSTLLSSPEPYTLLDFYVYTPSKQQEINRFQYHLQGHRALLLFLHDTWRIYDPVKITFPYRQSFASYFEKHITPDMYPYVRTFSYSVVPEMRDQVDALFVVPDEAEPDAALKKSFSQYEFAITYDADWMPVRYRAKQDMTIAWNGTITVFVWSWTEIVADDGSAFSIDLLAFDEQWWLIFPGKTLLFSKPILFLDATQEAYELSSFASFACTEPWVVIVPHTGTVSLGICRSGLFGRE